MTDLDNNQEQNNIEQDKAEQEKQPTYLHGNTNGGQRKNNRGMWYLAAPLLISFGTSFVGTTIGYLYILFVKHPELVAKINAAGAAATQSTELMNEVMNVVLDYATEFSIFAACIAIPIFLFMYLRDKVELRQAGMNAVKREKLWKYIPIVLFSIAGCVVMNNLLTLSNLAEVSDAYMETSKAQYALQFQVQLIGYGLIVPIMEELLYRGLIYRRLRTFLYTKSAILWSAVVFALVHGNAVQMLYAFALGMALAYFYEHYHSIKASILAHMIMNLTSVLLTQYKIFQWQFAEPMRVGIITVGCAFVGACMFVLIMNTTEEYHGPLIPRKQTPQ